MKEKYSVKYVVVISMFCAICFAAVNFGNFIPNVAGFLSYDPKDAVVAIAGFLFGPVSTLVISLLVSFLEMITISETGIYGMIMNFLSTAAFAFPAAVIYRKMHSYKGALISLMTGVAFMTVFMVLWNYIITPLYMLTPRSVVAKMLLPVFLPFNLIKGGINAGLTLILYKPLVGALRRAKLIETPKQTQGKPYRAVLLWVGLACLAVFVLAFLFLVGIL